MGVHMSPKFQVYKDASGKYRFRLRADNDKIVAVGEAYEQHAGCLVGIRSIQKNCNSEIEDLTIEDRKVPNPKYQIFKDAANEFRFHLKAANGKIIAEGGGCQTKEDCLRTVDVVKNSCNAGIEDLTESPKPEEEQTRTIPAEPTEVAAAKVESPALSDKSKIVFVGNKMPMNYVMAIVTGLLASNCAAITLKARGQAITTAVDAAEITRRRFLKNLKVDSIAIGTEAMPPKEGKTMARRVSTIEIVLTKE
jgi:DNA-binding protein Alba